MSVPRKRRLPAWHLLTDEGGKYEFTISVCSISFGRTGACSGEVLEHAELSCWRWRRRQAPLHSRCGDPERGRIFGLLTHCLRGVCAFCSLSRPFVCLRVCYALALVALVTLTQVRPHEIEHLAAVARLALHVSAVPTFDNVATRHQASCACWWIVHRGNGPTALYSV